MLVHFTKGALKTISVKHTGAVFFLCVVIVLLM